MKLRVTPRALDDIEQIADYLRDRNPAASRRVRGAIEASLDLIARYPEAGRTLRYGVRRLHCPVFPISSFTGLTASPTRSSC